MTIMIRDRGKGCYHPIDQKCDGCKDEVPKPIGFSTPIPFRSAVYEHIDLNDIHITSAQQLHDECKARGLTSQYVSDFSLWGVKSGRWI